MARILTVEQAAEKLQLAPKTVRKLLREGQMPGRKVGRAWRLPETEIERWVGGKPMQPIPVTERKSALGFLRSFPGSLSSEEFMAEKHAENEEQERKWEEPQRRRQQPAAELHQLFDLLGLSGSGGPDPHP